MTEVANNGYQTQRPPIPDRFLYVYSCDLDVDIKIKVSSFNYFGMIFIKKNM